MGQHPDVGVLEDPGPGPNPYPDPDPDPDPNPNQHPDALARKRLLSILTLIYERHQAPKLLARSLLDPACYP